MKLVFMGTPEFAVPILQALIDAGHEILSVVSQPDRPVGRKQVLTAPPVKLLAIKHHIPVIQPLKLRNPEARDALAPVFSKADAIVVAAYGRILPEWILEAPRLGCLNVHSSLLPKYRGAAPVNWAIANGETETGVTTMQMDAGLDTGAILLQESTQIGKSETAAELTVRLASIGAALMVKTLQAIVEGQLTPSQQDNSLATLAPILKREDGLIDWTRTSSEILNRKRGFTPFPGCYTTLGGRRLEIVEASARPDSTDSATPGTVVAIEKDSISVQCGGGTSLRITQIQPEGRRPMVVRDYLNGTSMTIGTKLGEE